MSGGGREGQSLRNILIKLEGEDPRQKGFHYFFSIGRSGEESKQIKIKIKKVPQKKNGGKRERGTIINKVLIKLEGEEEGRGRGTIMHLDLN